MRFIDYLLSLNIGLKKTENNNFISSKTICFKGLIIQETYNKECEYNLRVNDYRKKITIVIKNSELIELLFYGLNFYD